MERFIRAKKFMKISKPKAESSHSARLERYRAINPVKEFEEMKKKLREL